MRRLYLHIGYPKTGTTALQTFFSENTEALATAGILYPATGRISNAHYAFNFSLRIGHFNPKLDIPAPNVLRAALDKEASAAGCDALLVSSEYFSLARRADEVRDFFVGYDVKIVVYLRRHDDAVESGYGQSVQTVPSPPWGPTIDSYVLYEITANPILYDYLPTLQRWAAVFGKDALIVRPFERQQNTPDLFSDMLGAIGVVDSPAFQRPGQINNSLRPEAIAAIHAVRRTSLPEPIKSNVVSHLIRTGREGSSRGRHMSPQMRSALVGRFAPFYSIIARDYMGREDGILFRDPPPTPTDEWERTPQLNPDEVLEYVLSKLAPQLR